MQVSCNFGWRAPEWSAGSRQSNFTAGHHHLWHALSQGLALGVQAIRKLPARGRRRPHRRTRSQRVRVPVLRALLQLKTENKASPRRGLLAAPILLCELNAIGCFGYVVVAAPLGAEAFFSVVEMFCDRARSQAFRRYSYTYSLLGFHEGNRVGVRVPPRKARAR